MKADLKSSWVSYRKFMSDFATLAKPLNILTHGDQWEDENLAFFNKLVSSLCHLSILRIFHYHQTHFGYKLMHLMVAQVVVSVYANITKNCLLPALTDWFVQEGMVLFQRCSRVPGYRDSPARSVLKAPSAPNKSTFSND